MPLKKLFTSLLLTTSLLFTYEDSQLSSLYNGLDPSSITQHIALYKLYPTQKVGQKALEHAKTLLKKGVSNQELLKDLPAITESIDGFVMLMQGKFSDKSAVLDEPYLKAIESLCSDFPNRALIGHQAKSQEEVLALKPHEIDLSRAVLLSSQDEDVNWQWVRSYEAKLDFLALQVQAKLPKNPTCDEIIQKINEVLFFDLKVRFPNQYIQDQHQKFSQLSGVLDSNQGVCLGTSIVYLCLAQRLNLPLEIITPPGHIFVRYKNGDKITNIETTHRGVHVPSERYFSVNVKELKKVNLKQTICYVYHNLGTTDLMKQEYDQAIAHFNKALLYDPDAPLPNLMLGYSYAFKGEIKKAKKVFKKCQKLPFEDQITPIDFGASEDFLNQKVDLKTLQAAVLPPQEQKVENLLEIKDVLENGLKKYPLFIAGWMMLSNIYCEINEPKKALEALLKVSELNQNIPSAQFNLCLLNQEQFNYPDSWKHFRMCESILNKHNCHPKIMTQLKRSMLSSSMEP